MKSLFRRSFIAAVVLAFATLQASAQLLILSQPLDQTNLNVGDTATFLISAQSTNGPLQYQWRLNGVNIPNATNTGITITNVQPTNCGSYYAVVSDGIEALNSSTALLTVNLPTVASGNDNFSSRFTLTPLTNGVLNSQNTNASLEAGEPEILTGNPGGKSIWFKWTPTQQGVVTVTTLGSGFDTMLGVYTGSSVSSLQPVPSAVNDDDSGGYLTSLISFNAAAGTEYEIVVDGYYGASGNVVLSWSERVTAEVLPGFSVMPPPLTLATNGATVSLTAQWDVGPGEWYFNGQPTGFFGSTYLITNLDDSSVGSYVVKAGNPRFISVTRPAVVEISDVQGGSGIGSARNKFLDAANSPFIFAPFHGVRKLDGGDSRGFSVSQTFSTVGLQTEPGEPSVCGQIGAHPVWYAYIIPTNGTLEVDSSGSAFNTVLGVFVGSGKSLASLTPVTCGYTTNYQLNGQPRLVIPGVVKGQTNYIVLDGYNHASGSAHLHINLGNPVVITSPLTNALVAQASRPALSVGASGSTPISYYWKFAGTNINVPTTNSTLTIRNIQPANAGVYTVIVSNLVSVTNSFATISVETLPIITLQPQSQVLTNGQTATLTANATGGPPLTFQWEFDGTNIAGATGTSLTIQNFDVTNQGTYDFVATKTVAVQSSTNVTLVLQSPFRLDYPFWNGSNFALRVVGPPGTNYAIQASTNLTNWTPLFTNTTLNGFYIWSDTNPPHPRYRFYRGLY